MKFCSFDFCLFLLEIQKILICPSGDYCDFFEMDHFFLPKNFAKHAKIAKSKKLLLLEVSIRQGWK